MKSDEMTARALKKILGSFSAYYDVKLGGESITPPFCAEAVFHAHNEQYMLVRAAHIADIDSSEYVFFACEEELEVNRLVALAASAWEAGLSRVKPSSAHRSSDVTLVVISKNIPEAVFAASRKLKFYKSYRFGFYGWSHFRALVCDAATGRFSTNRMGKALGKLAGNL